MARKPAKQLGIESQLSPAYRRDETSKALRRALGNAVASVTPSVAAGACGCSAQEVCDALAGRRRFPGEWAMAIAELVGGDHCAAILAALLEPFGLRAVSADEPESDERYIGRLETALASFGEPGVQVLARVRKEARRG